MPFVRTILGDIAAADLFITHAHEHLVIDAMPADRGIGPAEQTLLFVANPARAYAFAAPAA